ncbi:MAG: transposase [Nostoc sp. EfeVER01]|uniref:helix-turn-helix domain-containing protein n=1 Tax=Nostoc sp. EfeVER01 TaxID=3075406 RepID=UPI002AD4450C|nr:IS630 transposase-related protein [Nostoc sp. EfeVER01]MDZ7946288.1 IS630 transposase-related protein [Nostoc sp. EfeVER01]
MKSYSVDLREKIVAAHLEKNISIRKVANIFSVSKSLVQKLVKQQKLEGNLQSKPRGKPQFSHLTNADIELRELVESYPDATLIELCEFFADKTGNWVGQSAMCRALQKLGLNRKKNEAEYPSRHRASPKFKIRLLGKGQTYRARKFSIFG